MSSPFSTQPTSFTSSLYSRVTTGAVGQGALYTIYVLAIAVVIIVVILIADNIYPFLPVNPISGPSSQARNGKRFWKSADSSTENLVVPAADSPTVRADVYTVTAQVVIGDSRTPSLGNFRHILHRGSNPCSLTAGEPGSTGHAGILMADLPSSIESSYKGQGLPAIMNPGLFLDKYKNDMHVFVHTRGNEDGISTLWLESLTVEDLPLNTPLNVGVICNDKNLEVYINCKLYSTLLLKGTPFLPSASNQWFGRYCASPMYGVVKNLQLWDAALGSSDYAQMCRSISLGDIDLPSACPSSPAASSMYSSLQPSISSLPGASASSLSGASSLSSVSSLSRASTQGSSILSGIISS